MQVTNDNKGEYVTLVARHRMTTAIKPSIQAFQAGLWEIVPLPLLRIFNHTELELMISGLPDIDIDDLKRNTTYTGLSVNSPIVNWFWDVVAEMDKEDVASLVQFVTGAQRAFCYLKSNVFRGGRSDNYLDTGLAYFTTILIWDRSV